MIEGHNEVLRQNEDMLNNDVPVDMDRMMMNN